MRDWTAVSACLRSAGAMKHKNTPRGGSNADVADLLAEALEEIEETRVAAAEPEQTPAGRAII